MAAVVVDGMFVGSLGAFGGEVPRECVDAAIMNSMVRGAWERVVQTEMSVISTHIFFVDTRLHMWAKVGDPPSPPLGALVPPPAPRGGVVVRWWCGWSSHTLVVVAMMVVMNRVA